MCKAPVKDGFIRVVGLWITGQLLGIWHENEWFGIVARIMAGLTGHFAEVVRMTIDLPFEEAAQHFANRLHGRDDEFTDSPISLWVTYDADHGYIVDFFATPLDAYANRWNSGRDPYVVMRYDFATITSAFLWLNDWRARYGYSPATHLPTEYDVNRETGEVVRRDVFGQLTVVTAADYLIAIRHTWDMEGLIAMTDNDNLLWFTLEGMVSEEIGAHLLVDVSEAETQEG